MPNSGFEIIDCPSEITINTIFYTHDWFATEDNGSTDSYHECYNEVFFSPPDNGAGFSYPKKGKGMAGFIPFLVAETNDSREVLSVRLTEAMIKDSAYCVNFFVKNSFFSDIEYGTDNIGVLFTSDTITKEQVLTQSAHVRSKDGILLLDNDWMKISGYYVAKGGEKFLNIGTFGSRDSMDYFWGGASHLPNGLPSHLYYFVDEVSVNLCDKDSLMNILLEVPNIFTPDGWRWV